MFSVPGWNLSTPIATQVETPKPRDPAKEGKKAQKRKQKQQEQVNESNIGEYWEKVVEGKKGDENTEKTDTAAAAPQTGEEAEENRGKKRKRKGNKGEQGTADGDSKAQVANAEEQGKDSETKQAGSVKAASEEAKRDKKKRKKENKAADTSKDPQEAFKAVPLESLIPEPKGLTPLQKSMRSKLASARFRHLNESLYTKPSKESLDLFKEDPSMFEDYHRGFAQQVEVWPENPVDGYVEAVITRGKARTKDPWKDKHRKNKKGKGPAPDTQDESSAVDVKPLPRNMKGLATIADLGCGTASLAYRLQSQFKPLNLNVQSFDLSQPSGPSKSLVTVADISALPLRDGSVDVAIFCLALMGVNWLDFIDEAWRILRWRGELWVSEIKSRFGRVSRAGKPPVNSIGSLKKKDKPKAKKKGAATKPEEEGIQGSEDEAELAEHVDGADGKEGTDVSAFIEVLRKRGFVLDAPPESPGKAIDLSNKMFVKMQFVKGTQPIRGKNASKDGGDKGAKGLQMGIKGKKFTAISDDSAGDGESDGKVLKPCLYKIR